MIYRSRIFNVSKINERISGTDYSFVFLDEVDSTSDYIKRQIANGGIKYPLCVAADFQTAGRGRMSNRSFFSPKGGLYFSCAFKGGDVKCEKALITVAAAVAAASAIEDACGCKVSLKWVNDVLINGRKVSGILCESIYDPAIKEYVYVLGIGVNASAEALGGFMPQKAGALPQKADLNALLGSILNNLNVCLGDCGNGIIAEYDRRLDIIGKKVEVACGGKTVAVTVKGISAQGLVCDSGSGLITVTSCNDVITDLYASARGENS